MKYAWQSLALDRQDIEKLEIECEKRFGSVRLYRNDENRTVICGGKLHYWTRSSRPRLARCVICNLHIALYPSYDSLMKSFVKTRSLSAFAVKTGYYSFDDIEIEEIAVTPPSNTDIEIE